MQIFLRWAATRGRATAVFVSAGILIGIQISGYGAPFAALDLACVLVLIGAAGFSQFYFIDGIARLEAEEGVRKKRLAPRTQRRVDIAVTGACAFLFWALSSVMLGRLLGY